MTAGEAQANPNSVTGIIFVFGEPVRVLFDSEVNRSFISTSFALYANRELTPLKNKLVVTTPLGERILKTFVFKGCEVVIEGMVLKANLIPLEMTDFDVILDIRNLNLMVIEESLLTYVITALEAKRLLLKRCEFYLAHVVDTCVNEIKLENEPMACEFSDLFKKIYRVYPQIES